jgi:hypothetical protein
MCRPDDYPPHDEPDPFTIAPIGTIRGDDAVRHHLDAEAYCRALAGARAMRHAAYGSWRTVIRGGRCYGPAHSTERAYGIPDAWPTYRSRYELQRDSR